MTYYEDKDGDWIVRFAVVKDLNALLKVYYYLYHMLTPIIILITVHKRGV